MRPITIASSLRAPTTFNQTPNIFVKKDFFREGIEEMKILGIGGNNRSAQMRKFLIDIMILDLWVLNNTGRWAKKLLILLESMLKFIVTMSIGVALFSCYDAMSRLQLEITTFESGSGKIKSSEQNTLIGITDASPNLHRNPELEREISHLKNKALSLEIAFRRMNSQMRSLHMRDRCKEEELADFASEAAGGSVLDIPDTRSYYEPNETQLTLFGIPLCKPNYFTPRKVIQPWTQAGECWAFRGDRGNVKIELAYAALIDQITLEHIPVSASLTGKIDAAPKDFRVTAILPEGSISMGTFIYNQYGTPSQTFQIIDDIFHDTPIKIVMLEILSNWGNPDYTCIYRFKVHGRIAP